MRFSDALGRSVLSVTDATTLGTVSGFVVDPAGPRVAGLRLSKTGSGSAVLGWESLRAIGPDAVTVGPDATDAPADPRLEELSGKGHEMLGKRVLTELGEETGVTEDAEFDPDSGTLLSVTVRGEAVDARLITGIGSYALVLRAG